jgi:hypothetical protein
MRSLLIAFRDRLSDELWSDLCRQQVSVLVVPATSKEILSEAVSDVQKHFRLDAWVFLCVTTNSESVATNVVQLWVGRTGWGLLIHACSGSSRLGLVAALITDALHAKAVYMKMPVVQPYGPFAQLVRFALRVEIDPEYDMQRVLRRKSSHTSVCLYRA